MVTNPDVPMTEPQDARSERDAMLEAAWGLIANASSGNWSKQSKEWQEAARRWREQYFAAALVRTPETLDVERFDWTARTAALERVAQAALNVVVLPPHNAAYSTEDRRRIWTERLSDALDALGRPAQSPTPPEGLRWHHSPDAPPEHFCEDCDRAVRLLGLAEIRARNAEAALAAKDRP